MKVLLDFNNAVFKVRDMTVQSVMASFTSLFDASAHGYEQVRQSLPASMQTQFAPMQLNPNAVDQSQQQWTNDSGSMFLQN
jgi:hypothetical protein